MNAILFLWNACPDPEQIIGSLLWQKLLELEDQTEEEIKDLSGKIESLEAITRMFELKAKNSADHGKQLIRKF